MLSEEGWEDNEDLPDDNLDDDESTSISIVDNNNEVVVDDNILTAGDATTTTASKNNHKNVKLASSSPPKNNNNLTVRWTTSSPSPAEQDDDDDFHWKDDWGDTGETEAIPTTTTPTMKNSPSQAVTTAIITIPESKASIPSSSSSSKVLVTDKKPSWKDDDDCFGRNDDIDSEEIIITGATIPLRPMSSQREDLCKDLEDYVSSLDTTMLSPINALLDHDYNTSQKALELVHYYTERPGLAKYTRTKELPRMNYQVVILENHDDDDDDDDDGHTTTIEDNQEIIARDYLPDSSIIARSANQSILADLLQALTGPNKVVRPQYLAMCVAEDCQFRIFHYSGDPQPQHGHGRRDSSRLQVNCTLQLSLPVLAEDGPRLHIATIHTTTHFSPHQQHHYEPPVVRFKVDKIVVLLPESEYSKLEHVVDFLMTMEGHVDQQLAGFDNDEACLQDDATPADVFRDAFFLEQSRQFMTQSKAGFKSAWNDVESVMGIQSKLQAVRGGFSKLLPDTNILLEAEEETRRLAAEREKEELPFFRPPVGPNPGGLMVPSPLPEQPAPANALPNPNNSARLFHAPNNHTKRRPKSILGELVKSGWGALANSIAIPDEDDPAIYGGSTPSQQPEEESSCSRPTLYRK